MTVAERIRIRGQVQGVGFRPFVWRLAAAHGIRGEVRNDAEGVLIRALAEEAAALDGFAEALIAERPPLARIDALERAPAETAPTASGFSIVETAGGAAKTRVTPDAVVCADCLAEIQDPSERRAGYAFANCTHCGPRFSIIERIPYDRAATTMRAFEMCADCQAEYEDPADRRFHAQPIACPACGPRLWLERDGAEIAGDPIQLAAAALTAGEIVALKGVGGFQLVCDATNEPAVATLRTRKRRPDKPFALMAGPRDPARAPALVPLGAAGEQARGEGGAPVASGPLAAGGSQGDPIETIRDYCAVSDAEAALLRDPAGPIVLLERRADGAPLAAGVAPGLDRIGWMAPTTPLHFLLLKAVGRPLVTTSGNLSGEPQAVENDEARAKLSAFADLFLTHNRPIARRLDDSVARIEAGEIRLIRRARGYAPGTLELPQGLAGAPPLLAVGGDLKAALCIAAEGRALPSHHLGDLEDALSFSEYEKAAADLTALFEQAPEAIVADLHPGYRSSGFAEAEAARRGAPLIRAQHHHAHIAGAMAEAGWPAAGGRVLGMALDGTGWGPDGTIWGGELLLCDYRGFQRLGRLAPTPLPGGDAAAREPWRNLVAQLDQAFGAEADARLAAAGLASRLADKPVGTLRAMAAKGVNTPLTSSTGRLFDAVAAALGIAFERQSYEGQTGMTLEALARGASGDLAPYPFAVRQADGLATLDPAPMWAALLADLASGSDPAAMARRFHDGFGDALADLAIPLAEAHGAEAFALSGGVAQNALLAARIRGRLAGAGRALLEPRETPANDGGLAFGQAAIAAARLCD